MNCIELYAGVGGLAMGIGLAGFDPLAVVEWDKSACDTLRENQLLGYPLISGWPLRQADVRGFDWSNISDEIDLIAGGPPCQPFSMGESTLPMTMEETCFPQRLTLSAAYGRNLLFLKTLKV